MTLSEKRVEKQGRKGNYKERGTIMEHRLLLNLLQSFVWDWKETNTPMPQGTKDRILALATVLLVTVKKTRRDYIAVRAGTESTSQLERLNKGIQDCNKVLKEANSLVAYINTWIPTAGVQVNRLDIVIDHEAY